MHQLSVRHAETSICEASLCAAVLAMSASIQCQPALTHPHTHACTRICTHTHNHTSWYAPAGGGCTFGLWGAFGLLQVSTPLRQLAPCQHPLHLSHASMAGSHTAPASEAVWVVAPRLPLQGCLPSSACHACPSPAAKELREMM